MSYGCDTCGDSWKLKQQAIEDRRTAAQKIANEKGEAQAICQEDSDGSTFTAPAAYAFANHFHILEVVAVMPADA